jgi:hypothetical protein
MQTPSSPAPLFPVGYEPPVRKVGPASPEYDRRVVTTARTLTMDTRGMMVERVTTSLGPRRSFAQDDRVSGVTHRALVAVQ